MDAAFRLLLQRGEERIAAFRLLLQWWENDDETNQAHNLGFGGGDGGRALPGAGGVCTNRLCLQSRHCWLA